MLIAPTVRRATEKDEEELVAMCRELHRENGMFPADEHRARAYLEKAFGDKGGAIIGVIGPPGGKLQGAIYLLISTFWYTWDWHLEELFSYVRPQYRRTDNARKLVRFAKRCSEETELPLFIGVMSRTRTKAKVRLYEREFADPIGAFFFYQPKERIGEKRAA
jgi:GNAT superfamily N-acetyltransferase